MENLFTNIWVGVTAIMTIVGGILSPAPNINLGGTIPTPVASFTTSLASKIGSTDTSMSLVSTSTDDGTNLTNGTVYGFVIDVGTSDEEYVLGTVSSSAIISMTRGVSVITGNTSISDLKKEHRRGASIKITDAPVLMVLARMLNGDETIPNVLKYDNPKTLTASSSLVDKNYADNLSFIGSPDASLTQKGIVEKARRDELANGSSTGDTTAPLFISASYANATSSATSTVPVTQPNGKLSSGFIDQTANYTWSGTSTLSGNNILSGTTTISGNATLSTTTVKGVDVYNAIIKPTSTAWLASNSHNTVTVTASTTVALKIATSSLISAMGVNDTMIISYLFYDGGSGVKGHTISVLANGTTVATYGNSGADSWANIRVHNRNSASSQGIFGSVGEHNLGSVSSTIATASANLSVPFYVNIAVQALSGTPNISISDFDVQVLKP